MTVEEKKAKKSLPLRSEIPVEETWRLEDIFPTDDAWEEEFKQVKALIPKLGEYKGRLGESPEVLYEALQYQDDVSMRLGKLYTYAHMRYDQDTTNSFYQGLDARAKSLYSEASSAMAFIVPEILAIDEAVLRSFLEQYEPLRLYAHALDEITRQRPHVLSAEEDIRHVQRVEQR